MEMTGEGEVLCAASAYEEKYYFNPMFAKIPEDIQKQLQIISVLYVNEIGGIFLMKFDEEGNLQLATEAAESDYDYDEIGAALMIKEIQKSRREMFESLELFYKVVVLGQELDAKTLKEES